MLGVGVSGVECKEYLVVRLSIAKYRCVGHEGVSLNVFHVGRWWWCCLFSRSFLRLRGLRLNFPPTSRGSDSSSSASSGDWSVLRDLWSLSRVSERSRLRWSELGSRSLSSLSVLRC